ncbi:MAG: hypothetical protein ACHQ49_05880 [Elusimicrobiota bacterium]
MNFRGLAAALLLTAVSARAQLEIRPVLAAPSAPGVFALASAIAAPPLAPALVSTPLAPLDSPRALPPAAAAVVPLAAAPLPAATPPSPAQGHAAQMSAALADFARTDLSAASAGEARGSGETLMLRALGGNAPVVAAAPAEPGATAVAPLAAASARSGRRAEPKLYRLSKRLSEPVRLGPGAIVAQFAALAAWDLAEGAIVYWKTHSLAAGATVFGVEMVLGTLHTIPYRTLAHLGFRYWRAKLRDLKELALIPNIERMKVVTVGSPPKFWGPVFYHKDNEGLIFVAADGELPQDVGRFGAPIPVDDATRIRLSFGASEVSWTQSVKDFLDNRPIPSEISAAWRAEAAKSKHSLWMLLGLSKDKIAVHASLLGADGAEPLGALAVGGGARKLIGLGRLDRIRGRLGWSVKPRAIPVSDSVVERPGDAQPTGLRARLRRSWQRLTGRLIVVSEP